MIKKSFWILQIALLILNVVLAYNFYRVFSGNLEQSSSLLSSQVKFRELLIARASAKSTEKLFQNLESQLLFQSQLNRDDFLKKYLASLDPAVRQIALFDNQGKLRLLADRKIENKTNVASLSAEAVSWSQAPTNKNRIYISSPFPIYLASFQGDKTIFMATPIYESSHSGTLAYIVSLSDLQNNFINPLGQPQYEQSIILDSRGVVVAGDANLINKNLFSYAREEKWSNYRDFLNKLHAVITKPEFQTTWTFKTNPKTVRNFLVSSNKIDVPNTDRDLYLVIIYPQSNLARVLEPLSSFGSRWLAPGLAIALISGTLLFIIRLILFKKGITS